MIKRILVVDGGGVKGFIPAVAMCEIEKRTGKRIADLFDLIIGSSVGAVLGASAASGRYSMAEIMGQMKAVIPEMFERRIIPPIPKYDRRPFHDFWLKTYGNPKMGECRTKFLCTSVNMVDGRTHFFKSWEPKDGRLDLVQAVMRSFAAPIYFESIVDDLDQSVWMDGGTGLNNCPVLPAIIETLRQRWLGTGRVHVLSLGCGSKSMAVPFKRAKSYRWLRQALYFCDPDDGGLARKQAEGEAVEMAIELADFVNGYSFQRVDQRIPEKIDKLDGVEFINQYLEIGSKLAQTVDYSLLA